MNELERASRLLDEVIPTEARRHGWGLGLVSSLYDGTWVVALLGPTSVEVNEHRYAGVGPEREWSWRVTTGPHGQLQALTPELLADEVRRWITTVWGERP